MHKVNTSPSSPPLMICPIKNPANSEAWALQSTYVRGGVHLRQRLSSRTFIRECHWDGIFAKEGKEMGLGRVEGGYDAFPAKASDKPM